MGGMITIAFVAAFLYAGKRLFSVKDWGKPSRTLTRINGVDVGAYKRFHEKHQGPGTKFPPVPMD